MNCTNKFWKIPIHLRYLKAKNPQKMLKIFQKIRASQSPLFIDLSAVSVVKIGLWVFSGSKSLRKAGLFLSQGQPALKRERGGVAWVLGTRLAKTGGIPPCPWGVRGPKAFRSYAPSPGHPPGPQVGGGWDPGVGKKRNLFVKILKNAYHA
jgi:hypothetical protein